MVLIYTLEQIKNSCSYILEKVKDIPETALILGSGQGELADKLTEKIIIPYHEIPHFAKSTAPGHAGKLVFGNLYGKPCVMMQGRFHYYEGWSFYDVTYPIRVFKMLGIKNLIVTNAAGGINKDFYPGAFMVITDHIKLTAENPLRGKNFDYFGPRFSDMVNAYDKNLVEIAKKCAKTVNIEMFEGVYAYMSGPCFETPAEIRALSVLGADAVGMSTVPEVIIARHSGLKVLGISCITNMAAGITGAEITSDEVNQVGKEVSDKFAKLIEAIIESIN